MYDIPAKPARWRGHPTDSVTEALMLCELERRGLTNISPHPPPFLSARWGRWSPDAVCPVPITGFGVARVYWEFKYEGWLQSNSGSLDVRTWEPVAEKMMAAYEDPAPCWAVIAQPDETLRLVAWEDDRIYLRRVIWLRNSDGKWGLAKVENGI